MHKKIVEKLSFDETIELLRLQKEAKAREIKHEAEHLNYIEKMEQSMASFDELCFFLADEIVSEMNVIKEMSYVGLMRLIDYKKKKKKEID